MNYEIALKISRGFGGKAGSQGVCGAVIGAHLVFGMLEPLDEGDGKQKPHRDHVYKLVGEFNRRFKRKYGSIHCTDLLDLNPGTAVGRAEGMARGLFRTRCREFVRGASEILQGLLDALE